MASSNPLDTLASEAVVHQNGDEGLGPLPPSLSVQEQSPLPLKETMQQDMDNNPDDDSTPLSVEEAAGGPPMPPAGQQGLALKEAIGAIPPPDDHIHIQSPPTESSRLALGHGDAAMAAIDTRLDEDAPIPHTNGYLEQGLPQSNGEQGEQDQPNELEYQRVVEVANSTDQQVQEGLTGQQEHIPPMSMDIEHPQGLEEPELPLPIAESVESAHEAQLAVDSMQGAPSTSETLGEATLPAPGQDNAQPLSEIEPEPTSTTTIAPVPSTATEEESAARTQNEPSLPPAGETSLSSIPDTPAPLPSQLVNHTAPTTDATQSLTAEASSTSSPSATSAPQTLENGTTAPTTAEGEQQPERKANAPPSSLSNLLDSSAPTPEGPSSSSFSAPIPSPSLMKRPFEDEGISSNADAAAEANYFGSAHEEDSEPSSKRQRVSPEAMSQPQSQQIEGGSSMQLDQGSLNPPPSADMQQGSSAMDADGEADADADAEGDSDMAPKMEAPSADVSMIDQSLDMSTVSYTQLTHGSIQPRIFRGIHTDSSFLRCDGIGRSIYFTRPAITRWSSTHSTFSRWRSTSVIFSTTTARKPRIQTTSCI